METNSDEEAIIPKILITTTGTEGPLKVNCDSAEDTDGSAKNCSLEEEIKIVFKGEMMMEKDIKIFWKPNNSSFFKIKSKIKATYNDKLFRKLVNKIEKNSNKEEMWEAVRNLNEQCCILHSEDKKGTKEKIEKMLKSISHKGSF